MSKLKNEIEENFIYEIARRRTVLGLTQEQVAEGVDVSPRWLQYIEAGRLPSIHTALRLISYLEIDGKNLKVKVTVLV